MILSILDIIGGVTGIAGGLFIMYKMKNGYIAFGLSNIAFAITGLAQQNWGLLAVSLFNLGIDIIAYRKWAKEDKIAYINKLLENSHKVAVEHGITQEDILQVIKEVREGN